VATGSKANHGIWAFSDPLAAFAELILIPDAMKSPDVLK
jgi:hypothetical protein